jgi:hypothetical protein
VHLRGNQIGHASRHQEVLGGPKLERAREEEKEKEEENVILGQDPNHQVRMIVIAVLTN